MAAFNTSIWACACSSVAPGLSRAKYPRVLLCRASSDLSLGVKTIGVGPAREAVDPEVERARLADELATAESEIARAEAKLGNAAFVERAPAHLVDAEREKVERYGTERDALAARLAALQ